MTDETPKTGPPEEIARAAVAIRDADALLITAGAGMGVDSGLPDFRGPEGFWRAYPPYRALGLRFEQLASPATFARDPHLAWGFYGHRLDLYRRTIRHAGFEILSRWGEAMAGGVFVFTSNVDGQFQAARFAADSVVECHGSIHHLQCINPCSQSIWPADGINVHIDEQMRAIDPLPTCPGCGGLARPNILMFGDASWVEKRTEEQADRYRPWLARAGDGGRLVIVECGAGTGIPTVRMESEHRSRPISATLIRINLREPSGPRGTISVARPALQALREIDQALR